MRHPEPEATTAVVSCAPHLYRWLSPAVRNASLVLIDVNPDASLRELRFDIDAVFNVIPVRRGSIKRADFYVAATGGRLSIDLRRGSICKNYTDAIAIQTAYENKISRTQNASVTLSGLGETTGRPESLRGAISAGSQREYSCRFSASERILNPILLPPRSLRWELMCIRGERALADFVSGNLYLTVGMSWSGTRVSGTIELVPDRMEFFGPDRRALGTLKSVAMFLVLKRRGFKVKWADGVTIRFEAERGVGD